MAVWGGNFTPLGEGWRVGWCWKPHLMCSGNPCTTSQYHMYRKNHCNPLNLENLVPPPTQIHPLGWGHKWLICSDGCEVVYIVMSLHPEIHPNSYHYQGCIFSKLFNPYRYPHKICTFKGGYGSKYFSLMFLVMLETILTLSPPLLCKNRFCQKSQPLFCTSFNPCMGLPRGYQLSLYPKKGGPMSRS